MEKVLLSMFILFTSTSLRNWIFKLSLTFRQEYCIGLELVNFCRPAASNAIAKKQKSKKNKKNNKQKRKTFRIVFEISSLSKTFHEQTSGSLGLSNALSSLHQQPESRQQQHHAKQRKIFIISVIDSVKSWSEKWFLTCCHLPDESMATGRWWRLLRQPERGQFIRHDGRRRQSNGEFGQVLGGLGVSEQPPVSVANPNDAATCDEKRWLLCRRSLHVWSSRWLRGK